MQAALRPGNGLGYHWLSLPAGLKDNVRPTIQLWLLSWVPHPALGGPRLGSSNLLTKHAKHLPYAFPPKCYVPSIAVSWVSLSLLWAAFSKQPCASRASSTLLAFVKGLGPGGPPTSDPHPLYPEGELGQWSVSLRRALRPAGKACCSALLPW